MPGDDVVHVVAGRAAFSSAVIRWGRCRARAHMQAKRFLAVAAVSGTRTLRHGGSGAGHGASFRDACTIHPDMRDRIVVT